MKDENQNKFHPSNEDQKPSADPIEGGRISAQGSFWKRLLAKKWVFPAAYLAAAAIILAFVWVFQDEPDTLDPNDVGLEVSGGVAGEMEQPDTVPTAAEPETLGWPAEEQDNLEVIMGYFDVDNSSEDNQAAMVEHGDTFTPHYGIDLARTDDEPFDVVAAMSGTVIRVEQVPVMGMLIEIEHENGLSTVYSSVEDVRVAEGDQVKKGDMIARSGRNELEKDLGNHVHFEVWKNDEPVNPEDQML